MSHEKWVSVKDALPEMLEENGLAISSHPVLAFDGEHMFVASRWKFKHKKEIFFKSTICDCCNQEIGEITHWTPLPEPPKEKT